MLTLYCFGESGNSYKAALSLAFSGLTWQAEFVDFFRGGARTDAFRALNEMGEVPVLVDSQNATTLSQSGAIQHYIVEISGKLGGQSPAERREILRWILWDNHKLSSQAGMTRFLMNFMPPEKRPQEVITFMQNRLHSTYRILDQHLKSRDWMVGDALSIADTACCGYLYYPEPFGFSRADWPHIDAWLDRIAATPGWKHPYDLMPGRPSDRGL